MSVMDDLRVITERADSELNAVHDFFEHSKIVWRSFQILVGEGHKVSAENLATGTRIDQDGLVRLAWIPTEASGLNKTGPQPLKSRLNFRISYMNDNNDTLFS